MILRPPVPLTAEHGVRDFRSGVASLDDWLVRRALANQVSGASRCYVVTDAAGQVMGYHALASGALAMADAPGAVRRNMPDPIPVAVLGRLAVDQRAQGQGLGAALLKDAVLRTRQAATLLGIRGLLVHAISDDAARFYAHHGFVSTPAQPHTLVMSLKP